ncbi:nose resistant to fluoxetine protein 6-like [Episyrphus balteatus]|uniref:nose resistant to fluoxetine protein 6-like n=1 Tax=Episyrphus balteatus TaxID=286459 RepID=UPI0024853860|nr:nose resistant to fluoxetine protein 6-like [Episyrphus balteatus]
MTIDHCTNGKTPPYSTMNIVAFWVFGVFTGLMILSSLYDFVWDYFEIRPKPILLAFSVLTNGKRLFSINTKRSPNNIDCLTAIRVISMIWIMNHHMYSNNFIPSINQNEFFSWINTFISMPATMAQVVVDSFFFIGGLLVAWIGFRDLDRSNGKINIVMNIVHRYIRLTPVLAAGMLTIYGIYDILYTGPFRDLALGQSKCNSYNWWPVLIYIHNYYVQDTKCYDETWYLAVDFQLYVLSPLLLIPMWKWGKKVVYVVIALIIAAIAWVMAVFFMKGFTAMSVGGNDGEWELTYTPMHTRCGSWLIGFILGYFMHKNRQTKFHLPRIVQFLAWIACFVTFAAIIFGPYPTLHAHSQGTVFEAAMYEGLKRVSWAIALSWITFACHYGFGGVVDTCLSHPFWQPFGRLTYALYLMHMGVIRMHFGMFRTTKYFSTYTMFLGFWGAFGVTLLVAIYMTLAFEAPILILEKFIFGDGKKNDKKPPAVVQSTHPQKEV